MRRGRCPSAMVGRLWEVTVGSRQDSGRGEAEGKPTGYRGSEVLPVPQMNKAGEGPLTPGLRWPHKLFRTSLLRPGSHPWLKPRASGSVHKREVGPQGVRDSNMSRQQKDITTIGQGPQSPPPTGRIHSAHPPRLTPLQGLPEWPAVTSRMTPRDPPSVQLPSCLAV